VLTPLDFTERAATRFADNEYQNITEKSFRDFADDIRSTFVAQVAVNVPDYEPGRNYAPGFIIRHSFNEAAPVFLVAMKRGFLPPPTDPELDDNWLPTLSPASGPTLSQAGTVAGMLRAQGSWVPGRLYRLFGREDQTGALDDVCVRALSAVQLEPTGYTISNDSLAAVPVPVSYDLATDTTLPVAAGAVDAYTKQEADELLAGKGELDVQQQHTLQLATLGVQGSPVYGYLDGTDEPVGYASLDEALADPRQKTFFRFNKATIRLATSNDPASPNWAYAADGEGCSIKLAADVRLSLPGIDRNTLSLEKFFVYQEDGKRGGRVKLLAPNRTGIADGDLPFWQGGCNVPVELSGGAIGLQGPFTSFIGTGTIHLYEPYSYGYVGPNITLVEHKAGAGGPGSSYALPAATATTLGGLKVGRGLQVDAAGVVSVGDALVQVDFQPTPTLDMSVPAQRLTLTNNVGFAGTSNRVEGRAVELWLLNNTAAAVTLTFPSTWHFIGVRPTTLAAGKVAGLTLKCVFGDAEGGIVAGYADES
jgi:hypothetical protein